MREAIFAGGPADPIVGARHPAGLLR